jgi:hypothetical protein
MGALLNDFDEDAVLPDAHGDDIMEAVSVTMVVATPASTSQVVMVELLASIDAEYCLGTAQEVCPEDGINVAQDL